MDLKSSYNLFLRFYLIHIQDAVIPQINPQQYSHQLFVKIKYILPILLIGISCITQNLFGLDDDLALASDMTTALNYLFAAWKFRDMTSEELSKISQEAYDSAVFTFPPDIDPRFNTGHIE